MQESDLALIAHLMRRAGFGASREELEVLSARSYEAVVEDLIHPERFPDIDEDIAQRYFGIRFGSKSQWIYRMVNTRRPLEEKIALFWHHVFATANTNPGRTGAVMRSKDSGLTWERLPLPVEPNSAIWMVNIQPVDPKVVFAGSRYGYLYRSDDGRDSWTKLWREFSEISSVVWIPS